VAQRVAPRVGQIRLDDGHAYGWRAGQRPARELDSTVEYGPAEDHDQQDGQAEHRRASWDLAPSDDVGTQREHDTRQRDDERHRGGTTEVGDLQQQRLTVLAVREQDPWAAVADPRTRELTGDPRGGDPERDRDRSATATPDRARQQREDAEPRRRIDLRRQQPGQQRRPERRLEVAGRRLGDRRRHQQAATDRPGEPAEEQGRDSARRRIDDGQHQRRQRDEGDPTGVGGRKGDGVQQAAGAGENDACGERHAAGDPEPRDVARDWHSRAC